MRGEAPYPYGRRMDQSQSDPRARHTRRLLGIAVAAVILAAVALAPSTAPHASANGQSAMATAHVSSAGSVDLHAFDRAGPGVGHLLYLEASWTAADLRGLRRHPRAWSQVVTVDLPLGVDPAQVEIEHVAGDLPGRASIRRSSTATAVTITLRVPRSAALRVAHRYATQILLRAPRSLDGARYVYRERIGRGAPSPGRTGIGGVCADCYVTWDTNGGQR